MPVTQAQCEGVMRRLNLEFACEPGRLTVTPPSWRFDLAVEEDLIEEVVRVLGYESLPDTAPLAALMPRVRSESQRGLDTLRHQMAALDYQETINFSFVDARWEHDFAGKRRPDPIGEPDGQPHGRDAIESARQSGRRAAPEPGAQGDAGARVRGRPRVPARRQRDRWRCERGGRGPTHADWRAWPTVAPSHCNGARRAAPSTSST